MKKITLLFLLFCSLCSFAQDINPQLFQTWYLNFVQSNDLSEAYHVSEIGAPNVPTLMISDDLTFNGMGACNAFSGNFASLTFENFETADLTSGTEICSTQTLNNFEGSYLSFLQSTGWYNIATESNGLVLTMDNPIFGRAIFKNYRLKTTDFESDQVAIYPNPSSSKIFINYNQLVISNVEIINSFGQKVQEGNDHFESVDISNLSAGVYFLKIKTDRGFVNKRIVKIN